MRLNNHCSPQFVLIVHYWYNTAVLTIYLIIKCWYYRPSITDHDLWTLMVNHAPWLTINDGHHQSIITDDSSVTFIITHDSSVMSHEWWQQGWLIADDGHRWWCFDHGPLAMTNDSFEMSEESSPSQVCLLNSKSTPTETHLTNSVEEWDVANTCRNITPFRNLNNHVTHEHVIIFNIVEALGSMIQS